MFYDGWWFFGMHLFWWIFWVAAIVIFFAALTPVPRATAREMRALRDTPLEILQRRYAAGQLTTAEYEERRAVLERDRAAASATSATSAEPARTYEPPRSHGGHPAAT